MSLFRLLYIAVCIYDHHGHSIVIILTAVVGRSEWVPLNSSPISDLTECYWISSPHHCHHHAQHYHHHHHHHHQFATREGRYLAVVVTEATPRFDRRSTDRIRSIFVARNDASIRRSLVGVYATVLTKQWTRNTSATNTECTRKHSASVSHQVSRRALTKYVYNANSPSILFSSSVCVYVSVCVCACGAGGTHTNTQ